MEQAQAVAGLERGWDSWMLEALRAESSAELRPVGPSNVSSGTCTLGAGGLTVAAGVTTGCAAGRGGTSGLGGGGGGVTDLGGGGKGTA